MCCAQSLVQPGTGLEVIGLGDRFAGAAGSFGAREFFVPDGSNHRSQSLRKAGGRLKRLQIRLRLLHLPNREQQRRVIHAPGVGSGLMILRITAQGREQIAGTVCGQGIGERGLLDLSQAQLIGIEHRGIIKTPLDDVDGMENGGFSRRLTRIHNALFAALKHEVAFGVIQGHFTFKQCYRGRAIFGGSQIEFGSTNCA